MHSKQATATSTSEAAEVESMDANGAAAPTSNMVSHARREPQSCWQSARATRWTLGRAEEERSRTNAGIAFASAAWSLHSGCEQSMASRVSTASCRVAFEELSCAARAKTTPACESSRQSLPSSSQRFARTVQTISHSSALTEPPETRMSTRAPKPPASRSCRRPWIDEVSETSAAAALPLSDAFEPRSAERSGPNTLVPSRSSAYSGYCIIAPRSAAAAAWDSERDEPSMEARSSGSLRVSHAETSDGSANCGSSSAQLASSRAASASFDPDSFRMIAIWRERQTGSPRSS